MSAESDRYDDAFEKLSNICEANDLLCSVSRNSYPVSITVWPNSELDGQISMLESDGDYNRKDNRLRFIFSDAVLKIVVSNGFNLSEALLGKLKNQVKAVYAAFLASYYRDVKCRIGQIEDAGLEDRLEETSSDDVSEDDNAPDPDIESTDAD